MLLTIQNNSVTNPLTLDLTHYVIAAMGEGLDPAAPTFSDKVFTHSLLKEGATLALENVNLKEQGFPLLLGPTSGGGPGSSTATAQLIITINQILQTPGATATWQDDGLSQPTYFTLASGQLDVAYDYRKGQQHYTQCKLRLFAQPFGTTSTPRAFAAASGVGPLLLISPYQLFSTGNEIIGASTQAGVAGFGGQQQPSGGIFYKGNPSLAGDAPTVLQISYVAPVAPNASLAGQAPIAAMSWLPDGNYAPMYTPPGGGGPAFSVAAFAGNQSILHSAGAVGSTYAETQMPAGAGASWSILACQFTVQTQHPQGAIPAAWAGQHRLFAIARASSSGLGGVTAVLFAQANALVPYSTVASVVAPFDWALYDLGTYSLRASEVPPEQITVFGIASQAASTSIALDITALISLPDANTWFFNPQAINASQYGYPFPNNAFYPPAPYTNTFLIDDTIPGQYMGWASGLHFAPSPALLSASASRISPFSRGIVPRPDPNRGIPVLALLGISQPYVPAQTYSQLGFGITTTTGGSWANPQNLPAYAQVNVLERARYVLP